jgi:hypothetical protein
MLHEGVTVRLALQQRHDVEPTPFYTASWRTQYSGTSRNRQRYWSKGSYWTIPVALAKEILERAERDGVLAQEYDDPYVRFDGGVPEFMDSGELGSTQREDRWREITLLEREPDWGTAPRFLVATEPGGGWRKIMIVDTANRFATFRSCTTDLTYRPVFRLPRTDWRMDNAMQDASTAIMRRFLGRLRC